MNELIHTLGEFVKLHTSGRDPSHGYSHMSRVAATAMDIMTEMDVSEDQFRWSIIVAWLHDVADHKYDKDESIMRHVEMFLRVIDPVNHDNLLKCIKAISFSTEKRLGYKFYEQILPAEWVVVRNIASDADKIEALGLVGIDRCIQYAQETHENKLSEDEEIMYVWEHAREKILHLHKKYIHTKVGKLISRHLHNDTLWWLASHGINCDDYEL